MSSTRFAKTIAIVSVWSALLLFSTGCIAPCVCYTGPPRDQSHTHHDKGKKRDQPKSGDSHREGASEKGSSRSNKDQSKDKKDEKSKDKGSSRDTPIKKKD